MNPFGKTSTTRCLILALGLVFACMATHAMAQNLDVTTALDLVNKANNLPTKTKPALTLATVSASELQSLVTDLLTTGTFYVNGATASSTPITGGTMVIFPATAASGADAANILSVINAATKSTVTLPTAAADLVTYYYAGLGALVSPTATEYTAVLQAAISNTLLTTGVQGTQIAAKADANELLVLETAVAANTPDYDNLVVAALEVSDPLPASEATLVYKTYSKTTAPSLFNLANSISTSAGLANSGLFLQNLFLLDKVQGDQESFTEGYTQGQTAGQLEVTASNIVAGAPSALSVTSRTNIALGLLVSGSATPAQTLADVTAGIVSGYTSSSAGASTDTAGTKNQATLVADLIGSPGVGTTGSNVEIVAEAGAADLYLTGGAAYAASFAQIVAKSATIKADTSGTSESQVAAGVGGDYELASDVDSNDIAAKAWITQGVVSAYKSFAPQIVDAVAQDILNQNYTTQQFATALGAYMLDLSTNNTGAVADTLAPNDALVATMLAALAQDVSLTSGSAASNTVISTLAVEAVAGSQSEANNTSAKSSASVLLPVLSAFYTSGSASTVEAISAAIALTGSASSQPSPDAVTAAIITAAKTTGTLIQQVAEGVATDSAVTSLSAYGNADGFIKQLATDLVSSTSDIGYIATGLAATAPFNPEEIAGDLANGAEKDFATISEVLAGDYPTQSPAIAAAIASSAGVGATSTPDKVRYSIATDVLSVSGSTYAAAVSGSVGATITLIADKTTLGETVAKVAAYSTSAPAIADAIAETVTGPEVDSNGLASDLDTIAAGIASEVKTNAGLVLTTATSVEQLALTAGQDPVVTGTTFGESFMALDLPSVVNIASLAAKSQTASEAGNVGVGIDQLKDVVSVAATAASVATTVAQVATPGDTVDGPIDSNNFAYYTVAAAFGPAVATNASLDKIIAPTATTGITAALAGGLQESGTIGSLGTTGAENQAAAALAYDLAVDVINLGYSSNNAKLVQAIALAVVTAEPQAAADIYGYIAEAVSEQSGWSSNLALFLYGKSTDTLADATSTSFAGALKAAAIGADSAATASIDAGFATADGDLTTSPGGGVFGNAGTTFSTVDADETPIVNF